MLGSAQPCFPLSSRGRKRPVHEHNSLEHSNTNGQHASMESASQHIPFDHIEEMTADEYLHRVRAEANQIPFFLINRRCAGGFDRQKELDRSQAHSLFPTPQQQPREQPANPPDISGQVSNNSNQHKNNTNNNNDNIIYGSVACIEYLISPRTCLVPSTATTTPLGGQCWVDQVLRVFQQLRDYIDSCREMGVGGNRPIAVPPLKDREGWHIFCVGVRDAMPSEATIITDTTLFNAPVAADAPHMDEDNVTRSNYSRHDDGYHNTTDSQKSNTACHDTDNDYDSINVNGRNFDFVHKDEDTLQLDMASSWKKQLPDVGYHTPTVQLVAQLDQVALRRVARHLTHYVEIGWPTGRTQRASWIYAILACMDRSPLHREEAVLLRNLLKALSRERMAIMTPATGTTTMTNAHFVRDDVARINTLMVIAGLYFGQAAGYTELFGCKSDDGQIREQL